MNLLQLELPLFEHSRNRAESRKSKLTSKKLTGSAARHYKTKEMLRLFKLEKVNSGICSARAHSGAYRHDNYVAIYIAYDKWEVFRHYPARPISA
jgi:hypothetical protein